MGWEDQVSADVKVLGADAVVTAMAETAAHTDERGYSKEAVAALKWNHLAFWALPRTLSVDPGELRMVDGMYFRSWVCVLDGVSVDGHVYTNDAGSCTVCGF